MHGETEINTHGGGCVSVSVNMTIGKIILSVSLNKCYMSTAVCMCVF